MQTGRAGRTHRSRRRSATATASGVAGTWPAPGVPLTAVAALVAYSRVHTGVHFPADVVAGALIGTVCSQAATRRSTVRDPRRLR
jgi:undecaprenyl-diphosphatase